MTRSNRGAARVSVVWMITVIVLFFAALAFAFVASTDLERARAIQAQATTERDDSVQQFQVEADRARAISAATGWFDPASADPRTNLEAMATSVESFKDGIGITQSAPKTLEQLMPLAIDAYRRAMDEIAAKQSRITTLEGELQQARTTVTDITQRKDAELAQVRQQLADLTIKYGENERDAISRLTASQARYAELDTESRAARAEFEESAKAAEKVRSNLEARNNTLINDLSFKKQPDLPDGRVLAVSSGLSLAWIDIGANQRLARGTRFRIYAPGAKKVAKGWAEVTDLRPTMAEVRISDDDPFDPVAPGDVIVNPVFSPTGERHAVLAGRFSTPSERELIALLGRMGIQVQPKIDVETDYLIIGSAVYTDEDGEPLDEPLQPSELEVYREAEGRSGIEIVPVQDLRDYFVF